MLLCFLITLLVVAITATTTSQSCASLGFNPDVLRCDACSTIFHWSQLLLEECLTCCTVPTEDKYALIVLEFDKRWIDYYESIRDIIKLNKKNEGTFSKITVKNRFGARPQLHLYSEVGDNSPTDSVSINNWSLDVVEDYIKSHLKQ